MQENVSQQSLLLEKVGGLVNLVIFMDFLKLLSYLLPKLKELCWRAEGLISQQFVVSLFLEHQDGMSLWRRKDVESTNHAVTVKHRGLARLCAQSCHSPGFLGAFDPEDFPSEVPLTQRLL